MRNRRHRYNIHGLILCGLVFFVIAATAFCMVANSKEAEREQKRIEAEKKLAAEKKEEEAKAEAARKEAERAASFAVQPGVPAGTLEADMNRKVVYLTFDDGPSENTGKILDILKQYGVKATFFITGSNAEQRSFIKQAYEAGHTIGLHTYSHDYSEVYASEEAYFADLEKIGEVAKEQIGYVPCFIRFPGGSSNVVSAKYKKGIMSSLVQKVQEKGYQYYDWNVDSTDGAGCGKDEIEANAKTDQYHHAVILLHDSRTKDATVEALPGIIEYYQGLGYEFQAIDRECFVSHHAILN